MGYQQPVKPSGGGTSVLNKYDATTAPSTSNDTTEGYSVGSVWVDVTADERYVCLDASEGAAVWAKSTVGTAAEVVFTPAGNIAAVTVQAAIEELDTEKAPALGADDNYVTDAEKTVIGNTSGTNTGDEAAADETTAGVAEIATAAEVATGTDNGRIVSPDGLAGSYAGTKSVQVVAFDYATDVATGDGAAYFRVPSALNGMNLVAVAARVITAGTTGTTDIQIANVTQAADMLSTKITIDSTETDSSTAASAAVIDTGNDDVATGDLIRIDVDAVSTTKPKGLIVVMEFRLP